MTQPGQPAPPIPGSAPDAAPRVISGSDQAANETVPVRQRTSSAGQLPDAAAPEPAPQPQAGDDLSGRAAQLEAELAEVRSRARGQDTVRLRVEGQHSALIHNGITVGTEWTEVPAHVVPDMMEGAANSGVTLTQEETES